MLMVDMPESGHLRRTDGPYSYPRHWRGSAIIMGLNHISIVFLVVEGRVATVFLIDSSALLAMTKKWIPAFAGMTVFEIACQPKHR